MTLDEIDAFAEGMFPVMSRMVEAAVGPLHARIADLEQKLAEGADEIAMLQKRPDCAEVEEAIARAVAALPTPKDGRDADPEAIELMVAQAVAALPVPQDGKDADPTAVAASVVALLEPVISERIAGLDVDMGRVEEIIAAKVAQIPAPQDGKSLTAEDVAPLIAEEVQKAVAAIPAAKDGIGLAGAVIDREGSLILTLTNGETRDLGCVIGRDADMDSIARRIEELVAEIPRPKDGKDGFSLDSFDTEMKEDGRTILLKFTSGDTTEVHELCFPLVIDRGVYKAETDYARGDAATWGGQFWIAQRDTSAKPGGNDDWRLAVRKGRDGKDGKDGSAGPKGPKGDPGLNGRPN